MTNPYATPKADLVIRPINQPNIDSLPRISTFAVILLSAVTLGLYDLYWMFSRSKLLNEISIQKKIAMSFVVLIIFLEIVLLPYSISYWVSRISVTAVPAKISDLLDYLDHITTLISYGTLMLSFIWPIIFRGVWHEALNIKHRTSLWCNVFLTALLGNYYLNYKINQAKAQRAAHT